MRDELMGLLFRGIVWFGVYVLLVLLPLGLALLRDPIDMARAWSLEFAVAIGLIAFAILAFEFALVSRLRSASEPFGTDSLMQFHRQMGVVGMVFLLLHVLLLVPHGVGLAMLNPLGGGTAAQTGAVAFWALLLLGVTSASRTRLRLRYESWQWLHALTAVVVGGAALLHMLAVNHYLSNGVLRTTLLVYTVAFIALLLRYRVVRPLHLARHPWKVIRNESIGGDTRSLQIRPVGHKGLDFQPGQFVWLATGRRALTAQQHPITIASSAETGDPADIELAIKAFGDWSRDVVPKLTVGTRVWLDGPYGALTPDRFPGQGFVLIAGGIGITPMLSILRTMRDRGDVRPVLLVYAADRPERMVYQHELDALEKELNLRTVQVFESPPPEWQGERGLVSVALLRRHLPQHFKHYQFFVCGPAAMMDILEDQLLELGVPAAQICTERFNMG